MGKANVMVFVGKFNIGLQICNTCLHFIIISLHST